MLRYLCTGTHFSGSPDSENKTFRIGAWNTSGTASIPAQSQLAIHTLEPQLCFVRRFLTSSPLISPLQGLNGLIFPFEVLLSHDTSAQGTVQSLQEFHGHLQMQEAVWDPQRALVAPTLSQPEGAFYPETVKSRPRPFHMKEKGRAVRWGEQRGFNLSD